MSQSVNNDMIAILIFTKLPRKNFVKTRLQTNVLTPKTVTQLHETFLLDTIQQSIKSSTDKIYFSLTDTEPISNNITEIKFFSDQVPIDNAKIATKCHIQPEGSFGERMKSAIKWTFNLGIQRLIVLGADSPHIQPNLLNQAGDKLKENDVVLGPSAAGGIYLIGLNNDYDLTQFENIFEGVELTNFVKHAVEMNENSCYLLEELTDIDTEEDLIGFISQIESFKLTKSKTQQPFSFPEYTFNLIRDLQLVIKTPDSNNRRKYIEKLEG